LAKKTALLLTWKADVLSVTDLKLPSEKLVEMYRYMLLARRFDEVYLELYRGGKGAVEIPHSHIGQEAIGVGACYGLRLDDFVIPSLRTRPAMFVRGMNAKEMMAGIFGKVTGPSRAKVTTHHIGDVTRGIIGTTGIVGSQLPIAAGVALANKLNKRESVVLCFLGDGATNRGDFHEALNFSAVKNLPVIYIVENNKYAMWTPTSSHIAIHDIAERAAAYGFSGVVVDGNDVIAVHKIVQEAVEKARKGKGPTLIECKTYRVRPHSERTPERRPKEEVEEWMKRDPITRLEKNLLEIGLSSNDLKKIRTDIDAEVEEAVKFAQASVFPDEEEVVTDVYGVGSASEEHPVLGHADMRRATIGKSLNEALREEMARDENVIVIGEDIGADAVGTVGGLWPPTKDLCTEFPDRVIGTPISESLIVGAAVGAALMGMRPVAELMFADFVALAMDQIVNTAAKMRYNYGGRTSVPLVVRAPYGSTGRSLGLHHSQCPEAWLLNVPGLKIVLPSTPYDAKGLLKSSIRDDDPVIFFEHKMLYGIEGELPDEDYTIPIGKADIKRVGDDATIVTFGLMVHRALSASEILEEKGVSVEIVDLRSLSPLDKSTIINSVKKTSKLIIVQEAPKTGGIGGEIAAIVAEDALEYLDAPIQRVAAPDAPVPSSPPLEKFYLPDEAAIVAAVLRII